MDHRTASDVLLEDLILLPAQVRSQTDQSDDHAMPERQPILASEPGSELPNRKPFYHRDGGDGGYQARAAATAPQTLVGESRDGRRRPVMILRAFAVKQNAR